MHLSLIPRGPIPSLKEQCRHGRGLVHLPPRSMASAAVLMVMVTPTMMVMVPVTAPLFPPLRPFLTLLSGRSFHQTFQRQPFFLIETLQNFLHVRHFLTTPSAIVHATHPNTPVFIGRQFITGCPSVEECIPSRNLIPLSKEPSPSPGEMRGTLAPAAQVVGVTIALVYLAFVAWVLALRETTDPLPGSSGA